MENDNDWKPVMIKYHCICNIGAKTEYIKVPNISSDFISVPPEHSVRVFQFLDNTKNFHISLVKNKWQPDALLTPALDIISDYGRA